MVFFKFKVQTMQSSCSGQRRYINKPKFPSWAIKQEKLRIYGIYRPQGRGGRSMKACISKLDLQGV